MQIRVGISTSEIHFIISKPVPAVPADATEVPTFRHKSSSTNGLAATGPQSGSNFTKKFAKQLRPENTLNTSVKSVFKSVHNHGRYLQFCDRHVCSILYAATRRLQLRAWPILCTGLRPVQLFLVTSTFFCFFTFFKIQKTWLFTFFAVFHTFSRTMLVHIIYTNWSYLYTASLHVTATNHKIVKQTMHMSYDIV